MQAFLLDVLAGWCTWSLSHNLGHRWWHNDMQHGRQTFYAHGERQHHRIYDGDGGPQAEDPQEEFISFPFLIVAPAALLFVAAYGAMRGWQGALPYAAGIYFFMLLDHRLHILFHRAGRLSGVLGWLQQMHRIHHATHASNFFFVSGLVWDVLLGSAEFPWSRKGPRDLSEDTKSLACPEVAGQAGSSNASSLNL